jgi:Holliday junction resolvasome RuvABC endonuclease subunit
MSELSRFVGLDLSLTGTGCTVLAPSGEVLFEDTWGDKMKRKAPVRDKIERMLFIANKVVTVCKSMVYFKESDRLHVGIENYAFGARGAQNDLGELQGVVKSQIWLALRVEPVMIALSTARKAVLGKGNFPKKQILPELGRRGLKFNDHNAADAYVVAECLRLSTVEGARDE